MFGMSVLEFAIFAVGALIVPGSVFYLALRWIRANERRLADHNENTALKERVALLEDAVTDLTTQLERLTEGQQFTTRLLEERQPAGAPPQTSR
jgi:hypothetical protein